MSKKTPDFETGMRRLQEIVKSLELGGLSLEDSVAAYKEGIGLARSCRDLLDKARIEVKIHTEQGLRDFNPKEGE